MAWTPPPPGRHLRLAEIMHGSVASAVLRDVRYEGVVYVSGSTKAWATIDDLDVEEWRGTIREIRGLSPRSGLHTIRIRNDDQVPLFAVVEIAYDEVAHSGTLIGRLPFSPDPDGSTL